MALSGLSLWERVRCSKYCPNRRSRLRSFILTTAVALFANVAVAEEVESYFDDYESYSDFVNSQMMSREFTTVIKRLGGSDEYTEEELVATDRQLKNVWREDFTGVTVFRETDLGGGMRQEARAYWSGVGKTYAYYYALLHELDGGIVVLQFNLNSSSSKIFENF